MNPFINFLHVLKHFKTSSLINVLGLSVALIVFFLVLIQVYYDFTYDRGYPHSDGIAQFYHFQSDGDGETDIRYQRDELFVLP
ncbi:MAG: hypothetical protein LBS09_02960 [Bacteroidales bacterium]|jgi:putative ABC transport system permease protein|nr:hypothetical protein [Bacteroidales bacterium]